MNERELILEMLMEILERGTYSHLVIRNVLNKYDYLKQPSKAFIKRVTEGTIEKQITIDYVLNSCSKTPVSKMKPLIRNLLRLSVYQLLFMDSVPDSAVCNEAVKLAGKRGFRNLQGFVNGVLRNIARTKTQIAYPDETDPVKCYSVRYSMPEWLVTLFLEERGAEITKQIFEEMQKVHPVVLRYCGPEEKKEDWKQSVAAQQITLRQHPYLSYAYLIEGGESVQSIPGYEEGLFTVQDVSSMLVTEAAGLLGDELLLDVCAAPGGKSLHVAEKLQLADEAAARENGTEEKAGRVEARDLTEYKTDLIWQNIDRSGLGNICAVCKDASVFDEYDKETADLVIADLPCSGLGVLGKKPDLKYRVQPEDLEELADLQRKILTCAQAIVKDGGTLMYSTCTVNPGENMDNVHWFLKEYPQFELDDITENLCKELRSDVIEKGCIQFFPGVHDCDGFFIARLKKKA